MMDERDIVFELAQTIREKVRPLLGKVESRRTKGIAASGDLTFEIDEVAEQALVDFVKERELPLAFYSEDKGLVELVPNPRRILIVDPIDGTRSALAGLESCVVSVALADYKEAPCIRDVKHACITELKADRTFITAVGEGVKIIEDGEVNPPRLSEKQSLENMAWSVEFCGRPSALVCEILTELMDLCSVRGGMFAFCSSCFSLTRIITGQLDAYVDVGNRLLRDFPETGIYFRRSGAGSILGLFPYDLAAITLLISEAGAVITDAYGNSLQDMSLLDNKLDNIRSCIATSTPELHQAILEEVERKIAIKRKT